MRSYSGGNGSFTLRIISAAFHTLAALLAILAPAARYSASVKPAVRPAPFCRITLPPSVTQRRHKLGVIETRVSPILISFGTPIVMALANQIQPNIQHPKSNIQH